MGVNAYLTGFKQVFLAHLYLNFKKTLRKVKNIKINFCRIIFLFCKNHKRRQKTSNCTYQLLVQR